MSDLYDEIRALIYFCFIMDMTYNSGPLLWISYVPGGNHKSPALFSSMSTFSSLPLPYFSFL
jgi:hypothetical protein